MSNRRKRVVRDFVHGGASFVGGKIVEARLMKGWNQRQLAREAKIPPTSLYGYENGDNEPSTSRLMAIAKALGVTTDYLLGLSPWPLKGWVRETPPPWGPAYGPEPPPEVQFRIVDGPLKPGLLREGDYRAVPLVEGRIAAGPGRVVGEEVKEYALISAKEVPGRRGLIAVRVEGDSMLPVLQDKAIAVLDPGDKRITPRGMYGVRVEGGCTIKRLAPGKKSLVLLPWNPEHAPKVVELEPGQSTEDLIIGRVVWAYQPFA